MKRFLYEAFFVSMQNIVDVEDTKWGICIWSYFRSLWCKTIVTISICRYNCDNKHLSVSSVNESL